MRERDITTIQVTRELKGFLASQAIRKGETYDQILRRLLAKIWGVKLEARNPSTKLLSAIFGTWLRDNDVYDSIDDITVEEALKEAVTKIASFKSAQGRKSAKGQPFLSRCEPVLNLRFGFVDGRSRTLEEIGKEFCLSREGIRSIEYKALRLLRHPSCSRKLKVYIKKETAF